MQNLSKRIGLRIRAARKAQRLTLAALAGRVGISVALLSRIERGEVSTTIANLASTTAALGMRLAEVFGETDSAWPPRRYSLPRASGDDGADIAALGYAYRLLCPDVPQAPVSALVVTYQAGSPEAWLTHPGWEVLYVLEGDIVFHLDRETFEMAAGDCLVFDSGIPHRAEGRDGSARTLMVLAPSGPDAAGNPAAMHGRPAAGVPEG